MLFFWSFTCRPVAKTRLTIRSTAPWILYTVLLLNAAVGLRADWLTFGHDPQRSAWASEETKLSPANAKDLVLKWSIKLDNAPLALNAPMPGASIYASR